MEWSNDSLFGLRSLVADSVITVEKGMGRSSTPRRRRGEHRSVVTTRREDQGYAEGPACLFWEARPSSGNRTRHAVKTVR